MPIIGLRQTVAPTVEPVDIEEARLHCRVDYTEDDSLIAALIVAARQYVEESTWRQLIVATWVLTLDRFPGGFNFGQGGYAQGNYGQGVGIYDAQGEDCRVIRLPRPRLYNSSTTLAIVYVDTAGHTQTLATSAYHVSSTTDPARITPAYGTFWPATRWQTEAVGITYQSGYGTAASDVPQAIKQAMLLLIGHWYQNREAVTLSQIPAAIQFAVDALLSPYRVMESR